MEKRVWNKVLAVLIFIVGTLYAVISDIADYLSSSLKINNPLGVKILLIFSVFIVSVGVYLLREKILLKYYARKFGFANVVPYWFSRDKHSRVKEGIQIMNSFLQNDSSEVKLATITSEWDFIKPYSDQELVQLFKTNVKSMKILMLHPKSDELKNHCRNEDNDIKAMQQKILRNSKKLLELSLGKCSVRWSFSRPIFHFLANQNQMHFGYYPKNKQGHYSRRYKLIRDSSMFFAYNSWFDQEWENALDAQQEIKWVEQELSCNKAVFLDRDDTLIRDLGYLEYNKELKIEIFPGVVEGLRRLRESGYRLIVISNQQAIGMQLVEVKDLKKITKLFKSEFSRWGIKFDAIYYCTHTENDGCNCRKPKVQLFERAIQHFHLDTDRCFFIGDSQSDYEVIKNMPRLKFYKYKGDFTSIVDQILG